MMILMMIMIMNLNVIIVVSGVEDVYELNCEYYKEKVR